MVYKYLKKDTSYVFYGVDDKISGRAQAETIFWAEAHLYRLPRDATHVSGLCSGGADAVPCHN
jgi:hypothetical protein